MRPIVQVLVLPLLLASVPAQAPLTAASFLPADYQTTMFADLKSMREAGIWDELDCSVLTVAFRQMEKESGMAMDALDRVRAVVVHPPQLPGRPESFDFRTLFLFEGNAPLGLPPTINGNDRWRRERIGQYDCHAAGDGAAAEVIARPVPELRVVGSRELVEPALTGRPGNGLPAADLLSLLSGRGDNLAYVAVAVGTPTLRRHLQLDLLQQTDWPADDQPTWMMLRLQAVGPAADPHLRVEAVLRHRLGRHGLAVSDKALRQWLQAIRAKARAPALQAVFDRVAIQTSGIDLVASVDLGRARTAVGTLAQLVAPVFSTSSVRAAEEPPPKQADRQ